MDRWTGRVAIVTGAGAGIGAAIATALVEQGLRVVGIGRNTEKLHKLAESLTSKKGTFHSMQCDLRKEEDILRVFEWTEKELGGVDVLINNAGVLVPGPITDATTESFRQILDVNVIAVAICTRETVRSIKKRNSFGHIININSVAGHFAESIRIPLNLYPSSKYAISGMTLSLRNEMASQNLDIKITSVSPGAVKTDMVMGTGLSEDMLKIMPMLDVKDVSDAVIYALSTPAGTEITEVTVVPHDANVEMSHAWKKLN